MFRRTLESGIEAAVGDRYLSPTRAKVGKRVGDFLRQVELQNFPRTSPHGHRPRCLDVALRQRGRSVDHGRWRTC